jgi:hypothetical protein
MLDLLITKSSDIHNLKISARHETIIAMPALKMGMAKKAAAVMSRRTDKPGLLIIVEDDMRLGFIMTANLVYARTASRYFVYVAQDAFPGQYWLDHGIHTLEATESGLLAFNDGRFFGTVAVFGLADRLWANSIYKKFLFYPQYKSHCGDTELTAIAFESSKLAFNPNCIMMEIDYEKHLHPNNRDDENLYFQRARTGFDGRIAPFTPAAPT